MSAELEKFDEFLGTIWMDNTREEAFALWRYITSNSSQYKRDVLSSLEYVLLHPPKDLIERMQQKGWIYLSHDDPEESLYSFAEHLDWLRDMKRELLLH